MFRSFGRFCLCFLLWGFIGWFGFLATSSFRFLIWFSSIFIAVLNILSMKESEKLGKESWIGSSTESFLPRNPKSSFSKLELRSLPHDGQNSKSFLTLVLQLEHLFPNMVMLMMVDLKGFG